MCQISKSRGALVPPSDAYGLGVHQGYWKMKYI